MKMVRWQGGTLLMHDIVAEQLKLRNNQTVSDVQAREIIKLNAQILITTVETAKILGEEDLPDTTELQNLIDKKQP